METVNGMYQIWKTAWEQVPNSQFLIAKHQMPVVR